MMTMQGKICLITGGINGIGKSTAQGLARLGAAVVIIRRDTQKAAQVTDMAVARQLWNVSAEMVHLADAVPHVA